METTITQAIPSKFALNPLGIARLEVIKSSPVAFYLRTVLRF